MRHLERRGGIAESFTSYRPWFSPSCVLACRTSPSGPIRVPAHGVTRATTKGGWPRRRPASARRRADDLVAFGWFFVRNSTRQDHTRDPRLTRSSAKAAALFVPVFAITLTVISFDFLMSLEPLWFSTMFGVYCFAGLWQAGLATLAITVVLLRRQGALAGIVNKATTTTRQYLFAFSVFDVHRVLAVHAHLVREPPEEIGVHPAHLHRVGRSASRSWRASWHPVPGAVIRR
jgi:hypothetical protein